MDALAVEPPTRTRESWIGLLAILTLVVATAAVVALVFPR